MAAPTSLFDALNQVLRANTTVVNAFGDTGIGSGQTCKFWSDYAGQANVLQPYLVWEETGETYEPMTEVVVSGVTIRNWIARGTCICRIKATDRYQGRQLGFDVANALNDCDAAAPISWSAFYSTCLLNEFLMRSAMFDAIKTVGVGVPTMFDRVVLWEYMYGLQTTTGQVI